jgi:hypothetical protein
MFHIHKYNVIYGFEDVATYQQCRCGKRRYVQYGTNVEPVNEHWLKTGEISDESKSRIPRPPHDPFLITRR